MIGNHTEQHQQRPRPDIILGHQIHAEGGKKIFVDLCENRRGKFIRFKECSARGTSFVVFPVESGPDVLEALRACIAAA